MITDRALFAGDHEPAHLEGYGTVPASWARDLVADATAGLRAWFRRLYTAPGTGDLVGLDSRSPAAHPPALASFIRTRDQRCRTPWCDAPIRHTDHVKDRAIGRPDHRGQPRRPLRGLQPRQDRPRLARPTPPGPRHTTETTTPTGHTYRAQAPPLPGTNTGPTPAETTLRRMLLAG